MAPAPHPGPDDHDYPLGSYGWVDQRKQDESFIAGFLFGCLAIALAIIIISNMFGG